MTLTWFEKLPTVDAYRVNGHFAPYAVLARDKRFRDAELAAEFEASRCDAMVARANNSETYWAPLGETWPNTYKDAAERTITLMRFATSPHYDQTTKE